MHTSRWPPYRPNQNTVRALAAGWIGYLILGGALMILSPIEERPLLIERNACSRPQWNELIHQYQVLHQQDHLGQQRFRPVIQYNILGEIVSNHPPSPQELNTSATVGERHAEQIHDLKRRYPTELWLSCGEPVRTGHARAEGLGDPARARDEMALRRSSGSSRI